MNRDFDLGELIANIKEYNAAVPDGQKMTIDDVRVMINELSSQPDHTQHDNYEQHFHDYDAQY